MWELVGRFSSQTVRAPKDKSQNVLHVFTTEEEAKSGKPSYNPGCLKWQVWTIACSGA